MASVIIPTFNDARYLLRIVAVLQESDGVAEIIIVDDGSEDEESKRALTQIKSQPKIELFTHPRNQGKAAALKTGFLGSRGDPVLFMDADLFGLRKEHVQSLIAPVARDEFEVVIGVRGAGLDWLGRFLSFYRLIGGDRALRRRVLQENLDLFDGRGFAIELSMNQRFFGRYRVAFVELAGLGHHLKVRKYGLARGLAGEVKMIAEALKGTGMRGVLEQSIRAYQLPYLRA